MLSCLPMQRPGGSVALRISSRAVLIIAATVPDPGAFNYDLRNPARSRDSRFCARFTNSYGMRMGTIHEALTKRRAGPPRWALVVLSGLGVFLLLTGIRARRYTNAPEPPECTDAQPSVTAATNSGRTTFLYINGMNTKLERANAGRCALSAALDDGGLLVSGWPEGSRVVGLYLPSASARAGSKGYYNLATILEVHPEVGFTAALIAAAADVFRSPFRETRGQREVEMAVSAISGYPARKGRTIIVAHSEGVTLVQQAIEELVRRQGATEAAESMRCTGVVALGAFERAQLNGLAVAHVWADGDIALMNKIKVAPNRGEVVQLSDLHATLSRSDRHAIVETYLQREPVRSAVIRRILEVNQTLDARGCRGAKAERKSHYGSYP